MLIASTPGALFLIAASTPMPLPESSRWFSEEVQPHEQALRAYLLKRFPSVSDHDDLVQEAYLRLLRTRNENRYTSVKAWLFTVTRNLAIDWVRRKRRALAENLANIDLVPDLLRGRNALEEWEREQRRTALARAIDTLPTRCREVMLLRYFEGLRYKEIAVRLGIAPDTVRNHMIKGVRDCTVFLCQNGFMETNTFTEPLIDHGSP
jgi:RNA polymerase sigma factor (sigma-70 family)